MEVDGIVTTSNVKSLWDVLPAISTFLSSVVLGVVALMVNASYTERQSVRAEEAQKQQRQLNQVQTLVAFMPHLSSATPETREAALFGISALGYTDLALKLTTLHRADDPQAGRQVADAIMRDAPGSPDAPAVEQQTPSAGTPSEMGWIYLGDYSAGRWATRYLDFAGTVEPTTLVGQTLPVRSETGALNVREGMPTEQGAFPRVSRALSAGTRVRILEVRPWLTTGYQWARVSGS